ncbi:hypothetical protein MKEN_00188400 [Mycena kentingensis (nom. inval.)]|nr:hypothetical protein MKEN_00188400 [Mycena kentingensis (nom. inval.)]
MTSAGPDLPAELWLQIFHEVEDRTTLSAVVRVSMAFREWGFEALLGEHTWTSIHKALSWAQLFERNPEKARLVRKLTIKFVEGWYSYRGETEADQIRRILATVRSMKNLRFLRLVSLRRGQIPLAQRMVFETLSALPNLEHLVVEDGSLDCALAWTSSPIAVSHLELRQYQNFEDEPPRGIRPGTLVRQLPRLDSLAIDDFGLVDLVHLEPLSKQLKSLRLKMYPEVDPREPNRIIVDFVSLLQLALPSIRSLVHLDLDIPLLDPRTNQPVGNREFQAGDPSFRPLIHVRAVSAPWEFVQKRLLLKMPRITALRISSPIPTDAIITSTRPGFFAAFFLLRLENLTILSLRLQAWDDKLLVGITRWMPACEILELTYHDGAPEEEWLFDLGIQHLPRLKHLHTLRLVPAPGRPLRHLKPEDLNTLVEQRRKSLSDHGVCDQFAMPVDEPFGVRPEPYPAGARDEEDLFRAEHCLDALREALIAWTQYNPALERARFGYPGWDGYEVLSYIARRPGEPEDKFRRREDKRKARMRVKAVSFRRVSKVWPGKTAPGWDWVEDWDHGMGTEKVWRHKWTWYTKWIGGWWDDYCRKLVREGETRA